MRICQEGGFHQQTCSYNEANFHWRDPSGFASHCHLQRPSKMTQLLSLSNELPAIKERVQGLGTRKSTTTSWGSDQFPEGNHTWRPTVVSIQFWTHGKRSVVRLHKMQCFKSSSVHSNGPFSPWSRHVWTAALWHRSWLREGWWKFFQGAECLFQLSRWLPPIDKPSITYIYIYDYIYIHMII
jgi:hypothetical protein